MSSFRVVPQALQRSTRIGGGPLSLRNNRTKNAEASLLPNEPPTRRSLHTLPAPKVVNGWTNECSDENDNERQAFDDAQNMGGETTAAL